MFRWVEKKTLNEWRIFLNLVFKRQIIVVIYTYTLDAYDQNHIFGYKMIISDSSYMNKSFVINQLFKNCISDGIYYKFKIIFVIIV